MSFVIHDRETTDETAPGRQMLHSHVFCAGTIPTLEGRESVMVKERDVVRNKGGLERETNLNRIAEQNWADLLDRTIGHEWKAIRQIHEEPVKQLREQAAALGETCVAAANLALRSFERAEARISALETTLQGRLSALSEEVHAALAELHRQVPAQGVLGSPVAPFPLEGVVRIHDELRESHTAEERPAPGARRPPGHARTTPPGAGAS
jgi:hypothetical protein